ncbi:olfactory receptor 5B21-like [Apteryx mantelli]|uniref:Olfactory receptor 5B21-like n=1 Tax=Apteryx mantelli TaxID=2696672 RepID=A0ABM4G792_9AVES
MPTLIIIVWHHQRRGHPFMLRTAAPLRGKCEKGRPQHYMEKGEWDNQTSVMEFLLLGMGNVTTLQTPLFLLSLIIYLVTVVGNSLVTVVVVADQHLHTPMYFFPGNLSSLETCYSSTILPRLLVTFLTGNRTISAQGCIAQFYFFGSLAATECYLLAMMSYDQYLAICQPLLYASLMTWKEDHIPVFHMSFLSAVLPFLFTLASYVCIIAAILRILSSVGRQKAFSTYSSHLIVVTVFYGTIVIVYLMPRTPQLRQLNKVFSFFYTVLTPLVNPLIYSLRNTEVREALRKALRKALACTQSSC